MTLIRIINKLKGMENKMGGVEGLIKRCKKKTTKKHKPVFGNHIARGCAERLTRSADGRSFSLLFRVAEARRRQT